MSALRLLFLLVLIPAFARDDVLTPEQQAHADWIRANYSKYEYRVPVRDGVKLHTIVYIPNWRKEQWPMVMFRTPYSIGPYGADGYKTILGPNPSWDKEGFIFVFQDVRGRFMSEGWYMNMRPHKLGNDGKKASVNESTDTYDSIEWLLKNVPNNNGKVGQWGISYPGFYSAAGMIDSHPALKVVSPQAPIADWFWDDMHHNGAFSLNLAFNFFSSFGVKRKGLEDKWPERFDHETPDGYQFFMDLGPLKNVNERYFKGEIDFWNQFIAHPNYDDFWQSRNLLPHLNNVKSAVMIVGGLFDSEDLYGPLNIYRSVEKRNPGTTNMLVMGPWYHGQWARGVGNRMGDAVFGFDTAAWFQQHIELPFFLHHLKDGPDPKLPEAVVFETGANRWREFEQWPPRETKQRKLFLQDGGALAFEQGEDKQAFDTYLSDPANPVPFTKTISTQWGRTFMSEDQRFSTRRPDVVTFQTKQLDQDLTLAGPIDVDLYVSTDQGDADFIVKLIDVLPGDAKPVEVDGEELTRGNAQLMVRYEAFRGRYRESFSDPKPFESGKVEKVTIRLQDVLHTFKKGHKLMVSVQSTYFPFFDRNPQKWVPNIFEANEEDFVKANHNIYHTDKYPSQLKVGTL